MGVGKLCWLAPSIILFTAQGHLQGRPSLTSQSYPLCPQLASTSSWIIFFITLNLIWNGGVFICVLGIYCCRTNYMNTKWLHIELCDFWSSLAGSGSESPSQGCSQAVSWGHSHLKAWLRLGGHFSGGFLTWLLDEGLDSLPLHRAAWVCHLMTWHLAFPRLSDPKE